MMVVLPARVRSTLRKLYVVGVSLAMAWALAGSGADLASAMDSLLMPESAIYVLAWMAMALLLGLLWKTWLVHAEGVSLRADEWIPIQAMAWAGRYLPGKVGVLIGKLALVQQHRIDMRGLVLSVFVEQVAFVLAGACVALAFFSPGRLNAWAWLPTDIVDAWNWWMPAAVLAAVMAMPALTAVTARALRCDRIARKSMQAAVLLVLHTTPHLAVGVAFYALAAGLFPDAASVAPMHYVAVLALAHVAGILAVFAPAGFGVREIVLVEGLRGVLAFEEALLLATILRLLTLVADGAILVGVVLIWRTLKGGRSKKGSGPAAHT